ncbi:aldo/keto reductase [Pseudactinotalea sp.]|uniref:aldo/keto reductase n=1 Tax=Pseudactinotalea sp. TaxID=1926260 RepID=UPI003B3AE182
MTATHPLGTMPFGDTVDEARAAEIVSTAVDLGVTELDTAVTYAQGRTEEILGRILRRVPETVRVSSKVGMQQPVDGGPLSRAEIVRCARGSVERLGRPLETLYLHQPDRSTPLTETVAGVGEVIAAGLAQRLGTSNHASWQVAELAAECRAQGVPEPVRAQQLYNPIARTLEVEFLPFARERNVEVVVYNPLAGGLLSGRYRSGSTPQTGRFADSLLAPMYRGRYWTEAFLAIVDDLTDLAAQAGMPPTELALRWSASHPQVTQVLVGASRPEQVTSNLAALRRGPLPQDLQDEVRARTRAAQDAAPPYAR